LERQRLDKWLWHARVVKARSSAAALVEAGHVRVNGVREKAPGHAVKAGDVLTIGLDRSVRVLKVVGFAERRGDAPAVRRFAGPARMTILIQGEFSPEGGD
jgi:ribosome-associated heat shock protein Hsp15